MNDIWNKRRQQLEAALVKAFEAWLAHQNIQPAKVSLQMKDGRTVTIAIETPREPLNKIVRMRDKYLKKYNDLKDQGKTGFAEKALQEARKWEAMLVGDEVVPSVDEPKPRKKRPRTGRRSP